MTTTQPSGVELIPVDQITPHPLNPRRTLGDVRELADSITVQGIRQNLLVVPTDPDQSATTGSAGRYLAVIGHRRLAAARLAGLTHVPAVIDDTLTAQQQLELMLVENLQRVDLTPIEEARGYQDMLDLGVKVRQIVKQTGRSERTVTGRLKLLKAPEEAQEKLHQGQTSIEDVAQLAEFTVDEQAQLLEHLGTDDYRWKVQRVLQDRERATEQAELIRKLADRGAVEWTGEVPTEFGDLEGHCRIWLHELEDETAALPAGTVWTLTGAGGRVQVYRPLSLEEAAAAAQREDLDERRKQEMADVERRSRAEREAAEIAHGLRAAFVGHLLTRKLTRPQEQAIAEAVSAALDGWGAMGFNARDRFAAGFTNPDEWLALSPHHRLLVALHEHWTKEAHLWRSMLGGTQPGFIVWYESLAVLGYQSSTAEVDAVEAGKAAAAERAAAESVDEDEREDDGRVEV